MKATNCALGRAVAREWLRAVGQRKCSRRRCAVARFSCRTAGQDTVEGAVVTYDVICRRGVRTVTWTVSVD
ncbi:MAG: hypothetical protein U0869_26240 [Chloroflexota bacterium]